MDEMTADERRAFLLEGARTASLATVRADGSPHVAPIWVDLEDDDTLVFTTAETSVKGRALRRDPRVALSVDDRTPPFAFVLVEGVAVIGERNAVPGELLVRVRATRTIGRAGIGD